MSTTPGAHRHHRRARIVRRAVLDVQEAHTVAELGHQRGGIGAADLRPVDVDLSHDRRVELLVEVQEAGAPVVERLQLPEVVVAAERHASMTQLGGRGRELLDRGGDGPRIGELRDHRVDHRVHADRLQPVQFGLVDSSIGTEADVGARDRHPRGAEDVQDLSRVQPGELPAVQLDAVVAHGPQLRHHRQQVVARIAQRVELDPGTGQRGVGHDPSMV